MEWLLKDNRENQVDITSVIRRTNNITGVTMIGTCGESYVDYGVAHGIIGMKILKKLLTNNLVELQLRLNKNCSIRKER